MTEYDKTQILYHDNMDPPDGISKLQRMPFGSIAYQQAQINSQRKLIIDGANDLLEATNDLRTHVVSNDWKAAGNSLQKCRDLITQLEAIK